MSLKEFFLFFRRSVDEYKLYYTHRGQGARALEICARMLLLAVRARAVIPIIGCYVGACFDARGVVVVLHVRPIPSYSIYCIWAAGEYTTSIPRHITQPPRPIFMVYFEV